MKTQTESNGKPRKAVSYIRFSSAAQGKQGRDSTKRQKDALEAALAKWNLELDATFSDLGKSGFHQKHLATGGAMLELRTLALAGKLSNKVLVVEDWDRTGRMQVTDAAPLLMDILNNGVDMVVGAYGGEYFSKETVNANPFTFYRALDEMNRGYGESKRKSEMQAHKWQSRREAVANGKFVKIIGLPAWLENGDKSYLVRQDVVKVIKRVFSLYLSGMGCYSIVAKLNNEKVPVPTMGRKNASLWNSTWIQRLLKNKALIGYYQERADVFPHIIDDATFYAANAKLKERTHHRGKQGETVNLFAGIATCKTCGATLIRHYSHGNVNLVCSNYRKGTCHAQGIRFNDLEQAFIPHVHDIPTLVQSLTKVEAAPNAIDTLKGKLARTEERLARVKADYLAQEDPTKATTLASLLTDLDAQHTALAKDLELETVKAKGTPVINADYLATLSKLTSGKLRDTQNRLKLREGLRGAIERFTVDLPAKSAEIKWKTLDNPFTIQLTKSGYSVKDINGVEIRVTDFNRE
jgi:DNA invertase Pin-like site-specific DNA recombinase